MWLGIWVLHIATGLFYWKHWLIQYQVVLLLRVAQIKRKERNIDTESHPLSYDQNAVINFFAMDGASD